MSTLVDWGLAASVARSIAGTGEDTAPDQAMVTEAAEIAEQAVRDHTGLELAEPVPEAELVDRAGWIDANVASLEKGFATVAPGLSDELELPDLVAGPARAAIGKLLGLQLGSLLGLGSQRVLGQYEFPVLGGESEPRLLFVGPNIGAATVKLDAELGPLTRWIALHEVTHAVHFGSAPWLREHLATEVRELLAASGGGPELGRIVAEARRAVSEDPRRTLARIRAADPTSLLASPAARERLAGIQATMAAIEGYAEHVMDAAAPRIGDQIEPLREAMERRRAELSWPARLLAWLLGLELKMRQYRDGKRFADQVVAAAGIETLNRAWQGPELLPGPAEIADPGLWLERLAVAGRA